MRILRALSGRVLPFLFLLSLMLAFDAAWVTVLTLLVAAVHELGHIFAAVVIGIGDMSMPRAVLTGLRIRPARLLSYREEVIVALGGPLANILTFFSLLPLTRVNNYLFTLAALSLLTAVSNLIPIRGFDGQRILRGLLASRVSAGTLEAVARGLSVGISAAVALLSLVFMMKVGEGYWIFALFFAILCQEILGSRKSTKTEISRDFERF